MRTTQMYSANPTRGLRYDPYEIRGEDLLSTPDACINGDNPVVVSD